MRIWIPRHMWEWECENRFVCENENVKTSTHVRMRMWKHLNKWEWECENTYTCENENVKTSTHVRMRMWKHQHMWEWECENFNTCENENVKTSTHVRMSRWESLYGMQKVIWIKWQFFSVKTKNINVGNKGHVTENEQHLLYLFSVKNMIFILSAKWFKHNSFTICNIN